MTFAPRGIRLILMFLDSKKIAVLKSQLLKSQKEIEQELKNLGEVPELGTDVDHFDTETDEAEEYSTNLGIKDSLKGRLRNIKSALRKMEEGRYGQCEKCKMDIDLKVLKVNPEARYCKQHKSTNAH